MRTSIYTLLIICCSLLSIKGFAGGACTPAISNGSCANATTMSGMSPGSPACLAGETTCGGSTSVASCGGTHVDCAWYQFQATATDMYVQIDWGSSDGCISSSSVFSGSCGSLTELDCESGGALDDYWSYTSLTVNDWYYVQVCYPANAGGCGGGGSDGSFTFDICIGEPEPPCNTCADPCGTAAGYAAAPTIATVVADCTTQPFAPELQPGSTNTFCYDFQATATSVDFNVIITSDCGGGNVSNFTWSLYSLACGAPIQTGTLASLTFAGLTVGTGYVFCYTFDVPAGCTHSQHCPFFVGATPLPVTITDFNAEVIDNRFINLDWITASEINNDYFTIEKSKDGEIFEVVGIVDGAGNSNMVNNYNSEDHNPYMGTSYYRLKQTDFDNNFSYSDIIGVKISDAFEDLIVYPNPVTKLVNISFNANMTSTTTVRVFDISGREVMTKNFISTLGANTFRLNTEELGQGMYFISLNNADRKTSIKFIKD